MRTLDDGMDMDEVAAFLSKIAFDEVERESLLKE
jgi:hypothetical protein